MHISFNSYLIDSNVDTLNSYLIDSNVDTLHHSIGVGNLTSKPSSRRGYSFSSIEADPLLPSVAIKAFILSPDWNLTVIGVEELAKAIGSSSAAVRSVSLAQKCSLTLSDVIQVYCAIVGEYLTIQFKVDICGTDNIQVVIIATKHSLIYYY